MSRITAVPTAQAKMSDDSLVRSIVLGIVAWRLTLALGLAAWMSFSPPLEVEESLYCDVPRIDSLWGDLLVKWDSYWYLNIAEFGYMPPLNKSDMSNLAFAPLYPFLIGLLHSVGFPAALAGVLVACSCYCALLYYTYQFGIMLYSRRTAAYLMFFVSVFPSAWVFNMVYTEALFCALIAAFLTYYLRGKHLAAGIAAFLLPLTRIAGIALLPAVALDMGYRVWKGEKLCGCWKSLLAAMLGIVVLGSVYTAVAGSPTAFRDASMAWPTRSDVKDHVFQLPASLIKNMTELNEVFVYALFGCVYAAACYQLLRQRRDISTWLSISYMFMLLTTPHVSHLRYLLPLLPLHAVVCHTAYRRGLLAPLLVGLALIQFVMTKATLSWSVIL